MGLVISKNSTIGAKTAQRLNGMKSDTSNSGSALTIANAFAAAFGGESIAFENIFSFGKDTRGSNGALYWDLPDPFKEPEGFTASGALSDPDIEKIQNRKRDIELGFGFLGYNDYLPWADVDKLGNPILINAARVVKGAINRTIDVAPFAVGKAGAAYRAGRAGLVAVKGLPAVRGLGIRTGILGLVRGAMGRLTSSFFVKMGILMSLPSLWSAATRTTQFLWNFNWNASDKELNEQLKSQMTSLYGLTGGFIGASLGWLVCGALPGAAAFAFNPAVARAILEEVGDEAKDELMSQLAQCANTAFKLLASQMVAKGFMGARKWIKRPGTPLHDAIKAVMGAENFKRWGDEGRPTLSFAQNVEDRVEAIKDPNLRNFTEEFLENFSDACLEAGYTVVNTIESQLAAQRLMQKAMLGEQQTVAIDFNPAD